VRKVRQVVIKQGPNAGQKMGVIELEDLTSASECVIPPKLWATLSEFDSRGRDPLREGHRRSPSRPSVDARGRRRSDRAGRDETRGSAWSSRSTPSMRSKIA
jgi:hypothetical protein